MARENARPGTPQWRLRRIGPNQAIEGYADRVSVRPGQRVRLYVSTTAATYWATAYRVGWYGGAQGRQVWTSPELQGQRQRAPVVSRPLNTVTARWKPTATIPTHAWPPGDYLIKLRSDAGYERYIPLTVRSSDTRGTVVLLNGVTTWQAYNRWGGYDLYRGPGGYSDRSRAVSFDRPYDNAGIQRFLAEERAAVVLAERLHLPLAYITDIDLATRPGILARARALISLGHDEYWTSSMRSAALEAREHGTNLAFLGADAVSRHARLGSTSLGANRLVICYKSAGEDPMSATDPADSTQDWRAPPDPRPATELTGLIYDCFPADAGFVIATPDSWLFAGTGVRRHTRFPHLVGIESDRLDLSKPTPRPLEILSDSPVNCAGRPTWSNSAYYSSSSGAGVFNAGTMRWVPALDHDHQLTPRTWRFVQTVTTTMLRTFARGPAGTKHPADDNANSYTHVP